MQDTRPRSGLVTRLLVVALAGIALILIFALLIANGTISAPAFGSSEKTTVVDGPTIGMASQSRAVVEIQSTTLAGHRYQMNLIDRRDFGEIPASFAGGLSISAGISNHRFFADENDSEIDSHGFPENHRIGQLTD